MPLGHTNKATQLVSNCCQILQSANKLCLFIKTYTSLRAVHVQHTNHSQFKLLTYIHMHTFTMLVPHVVYKFDTRKFFTSHALITSCTDILISCACMCARTDQ